MKLKPNNQMKQTQINNPVGGSLAPSSCSVDSIIKASRHTRLIQGLYSISAWCASRAAGEHDDETTMTMLQKKTSDLSHAIDRAGWNAASDFLKPNAEVSDDPLKGSKL